MERVTGYVVGRKTVHGVSTWTVGTRENGELVRKFRVASVSSGVVLWPGLDVDFLTQENNGQTVAVDVAPRVVTETRKQGKRDMKRTILISIAALMVVVALLLGHLAMQSKMFRDQVLELRLENAISTLKGMTLGEMISDEIVMKAIVDSYWGGNMHSARQMVLDQHLCPVFGDSYGSENSRCYSALYASGGDGTGENYHYDRAGIPGNLAPRVSYFRSLMLDKARVVLKDPDSLWAFYQAKKRAAVKAFHESTPEQQGYTRTKLAEAKVAFAKFGDPDLRSALDASVAADAAWWNKGNVDRSKWDAMRAAEKELSEEAERLGTNAYYVSFANRRFMEGGRFVTGGPRLIATWLRVIDDLIKEAAVN